MSSSDESSFPSLPSLEEDCLSKEEPPTEEEILCNKLLPKIGVRLLNHFGNLSTLKLELIRDRDKDTLQEIRLQISSYSFKGKDIDSLVESIFEILPEIETT